MTMETDHHLVQAFETAIETVIDQTDMARLVTATNGMVTGCWDICILCVVVVSIADTTIPDVAYYCSRFLRSWQIFTARCTSA